MWREGRARRLRGGLCPTDEGARAARLARIRTLEIGESPRSRSFRWCLLAFLPTGGRSPRLFEETTGSLNTPLRIEVSAEGEARPFDEMAENLVPLNCPSPLVFSPNGELWFIPDFAGASGKLAVLREDGTERRAIKTVVRQFSGPEDDDPYALDLAPPGFESALVKPGDVLIVDCGVDGDGTNGRAGD